MKPSDLIRSRDGSLSLTKLASATAHALMAVGFVHITWKQGFVAEMWTIYASATVFHAAWDKTAAMVKDFKDKQLSGAP